MPRGSTWDLFVSHSSQDKETFVRPLCRALSALGMRVWYDEDSIPPGFPIPRSISTGLVESRYIAIVISPSLLRGRKWTEIEINTTIGVKEISRGEVIPILLGVSMDDFYRELPMLASLNAIDGGRGVEHVCRQLALAVDASLICDDGKSITRLWYGTTGRLRVASGSNENLLFALYDWFEKPWVGELVGIVEDNVFFFRWSWSVNSNAGFGRLQKTDQMLHGYWYTTSRKCTSDESISVEVEGSEERRWPWQFYSRPIVEEYATRRAG